MKKLIIAVLSLMMITTVFADEAKLRMKISGPVNNNRYFLCVSNVGCVSIFSGNKGKVYPLDTGEISNIYTVDGSNLSMHTQTLPSSCNVTVKDNQTLTVKGTLVKGTNGKVVISNMHCSIG